MKKLVALLIVVGLGLVLGAYWFNPSSRASTEEGFAFALVERGSLVDAVSATGQVQPREVSVVGSEVSGKVVEISANADFDHVVKKGEVLLKLDDRQARLKLDDARATVELARANVAQARAAQSAADAALQHIRELVNKDVKTKPDLIEAEKTYQAASAAVQTAEAKVQQAEVGVRAAQLGLDLTSLHAPVSGRILDRKVLRDQLIGPPASGHLFTIASDLDRLQVNAQVAEADIGKVRVGMPTTFTVYAYADSNFKFQGKVNSIHPLPTPMPTQVQGAVFYSVIIDAENRHAPGAEDPNAWLLRPGMTATVDIRLRQHANAWKIPSAALNLQLDPAYETPEVKRKLAEWQHRADHDQWKTVWVMRDQHPWPIFVRTGGVDAAGESGIHDGQYVEGLQWEPDLQPAPEAASPGSYPRLIIAAPPARKPSIFDRPTFKIS